MSKHKRKNKKTGKSNNAIDLHKLAQQAKASGRPKRAIQYLRKAIVQNPKDARAFFYLGNILGSEKCFQEAIDCYNKALVFDPDNPAIQLNVANTLQKTGQLQQAKTVYQEVLKANPELAVAHFNFGLVLQNLGDLDGAVTSFRKALALQPELTPVYHRLAKTLVTQNQLLDAIDVYHTLLRFTPEYVSAYCELGDLLQKIAAYDPAKKAYVSALQLEPDNAEIWYLLGTAQQQQNLFKEAIVSYQRSIAIKPDQLRVRANLGNAFYQTGDMDAAVKQYQAALAINPLFSHARFGYCISQLPIIYQSEAHIAQCQEKYLEELDPLYDYYFNASIEECAKAASAVGFVQPFYLSYQGLPMREAQQRYGAVIGRLMAARYPEFVKPIAMPIVKTRIRLGIVSGFFKDHACWNVFQGLFEAIDRSRFELYLFHTRSDCDRETRLLEHLCDGFTQGPKAVGEWAETIRKQQLHALFFPEFGMDPMCVQLGCLRLAPIQLTSWGHPVTSGLETIDYYLSSELMEPENGQSDYSEKLVNLPNLAMHYRFKTVNLESVSRAELDIPESAVIYWCCQSLFKYLPRHDDVFPRIAKHVKDARFLFVSFHGGVVEQLFRQRLSTAFAKEGLDMEQYCQFLPRQTKAKFLAITTLCDIFLDSIDWSGCNSSLDAIAAGLPILTLPGEFMRGRHTLAFLRMMRLDEWIATDKNHYIKLAAQLGQDQSLRDSVSAQIQERKHCLSRDPKPVQALASFLISQIAAFEPKATEASAELEPLTSLEEQAKSAPDDSRILSKLARQYQNLGDLDQAAEFYQRSLNIQNPHYAATKPRQAKPPLQVAHWDLDQIKSSRTELKGLSYPAIAPVINTNNRPFWSVVIPMYNRDNYVLECLASVLAQWQGNEHMEIIVIDNGSEPSLETRVASISKGIVYYHRHEQTIPLQCNWNSAVNASRGRWIHLLHDDDYVLPGFYNSLQKSLENCPKTIGAAFTAYENIDDQGAVIFRRRFGEQRGILKNWVEEIGVSNVLNPPAVVVRREAYERIGGYSDDILFTTDWELYMRLASFYDWWYEPEILVHYRQHQLNVTAEQNKAGAQGEAFSRAIEMSAHYLPETIRQQTLARSRRYYFNWSLQRLRLPLQTGNTEGALQLLRAMLAIDNSEDSLHDLFDWLATTFAKPLWPIIIDAYHGLAVQPSKLNIENPGAFFDWLRSSMAKDTRSTLADVLKKQ